MKVTSAFSAQNFCAETKDLKKSFEKNSKTENKKKEKYVDPLANWPLRGLGYTNDIGIAINELAPKTARLFWVPALMYFGADIYDKYKNKGNKYNPNAQRAFLQAVFQAFASIIFPAVFGHVGMSAFSQIDKLKGEKLSTNAKEQTLRFIKGHSAINDISQSGKVKEEVIDEFNEGFNKFYKAMSKSYKNKNIFVKLYDKVLGNCKRGAVANSDEKRLKDYAQRQFLEVFESCKDTEAANLKFDKKIFKLKAWKSAGAFTAIILTAKMIDDFVEKVIITKVVKPQISKIKLDNIKKIGDFGTK